jgi:poly(3-hydroxybutyrate) depolymerase
MFYHLYELNHAALQPARALADATRIFYQHPLNPMSRNAFGRSIAAMAEMFERTTRQYGKPEFGLAETKVDFRKVKVTENHIWSKPFCDLIHFERDLPANRKNDPKILIVAPMSGHYATLLRGTVEAFLPHGEVYITDWTDARKVPLTSGMFDLDSYIDYLIEIFQFLGPDTHVIAVCQPSVPVLAAVSVMEARGDKLAPASMTLMGGPIDTRRNPTAVNQMAEKKDLSWFANKVIMRVPYPNQGFMREVYPGFLQLSGFMSMNLDRHVDAHREFYKHLVKDDGDSAEKHAVMDLTAEFYLQTVDTVFIRHALPKGEMMYRTEKVDPSAITNTSLMTVEGENDDISGVGQTEAAHKLCVNIPSENKVHYLQPKVGHYGVFNGSRFRSEIAPRILDFIQTRGVKAKKRARA